MLLELQRLDPSATPVKPVRSDCKT